VPGDDHRDPADDGRRRYLIACTIGAGIGLAVQLGLLLNGGLLRHDVAGSFYDVQGRAFLHGDLAVPPGSLGIEEFVVDGRSYTYFGPVPALARLPVLAVTERFDGRLTGLSLLLAGSLTAAALTALLWRVRGLRRGGDPVSTGESAVAGMLVASLLGGSALLYLSARPIVYHEAIAWGLALTLAGTWVVLGVAVRPTAGRVVAAAAFALLATLTRSPSGIGLSVALGAVAAVLAWRAWRSRAGAHPSAGMGPIIAVVAAAAVPFVAGAALNVAKFGSPLGLPMEDQVYSQVVPERQAMLAANDGRYFRVAFVPTNAVQYLRPDGVGLDRVLPFVELPRRDAIVLGDLVYDQIDDTSSVWVAFPPWSVVAMLGAVGLVAPAGDRRARARVRSTTLPVLFGLVVGTAGVLTIGYIANRYLVDLFPPIALLAAIGGAELWGRLDGAGTPGRRRLAVAVVAAMAAVGLAVNLAIAVDQQYTSTDRARRAEWVGWQERLDDRAFDALPDRVTTGEAPPPRGRPGDLFIAGDCVALYRSSGAELPGRLATNWQVVEGTTEAGHHRGSVDLDRLEPGSSVLVLRVGDEDPAEVWLDRDPDGRLVGRVEAGGFGGTGSPVEWDGSSTPTLEVVADPRLSLLELGLDGRQLVAVPFGREDAQTFLPSGGRPEQAGAAAGPAVVPEPSETPICRRLQARLDDRGEAAEP
jgi:hypothetical protein